MKKPRANKIKQMKGGMMLLPAAAGTCEECAVAHAPEMPHNPQSFYYQVRFGNDHGRAATWKDAMAHCTPKMKKLWKAQLLAMWGIKDINDPKNNNFHEGMKRP